MNKILLKTAVESLTPEHGKEIVNIYKSYGVDINELTGSNSLYNNAKSRYYGCNDSPYLYNLCLDEVLDNGINLMKLENLKSLIRNEKISMIL